MRLVSLVVASVVMLGLPFGKASAVIIGELEFVEPRKVISADESIDVWMRLTLDGTSDPLMFSTFADFPNGLPLDLLPLYGTDNFTGEQFIPFSFYESIGVYFESECSETAFGLCGQNTSQYAIGDRSDWLDILGSVEPLILAPGDSFEFLLYDLNPVNGSVQPGTYALDQALAGFDIFGRDAQWRSISNIVLQFGTCDNAFGTDCNFTRTVLPISEPSVAFIFVIVMGGMLFRRRVMKSVIA